LSRNHLRRVDRGFRLEIGAKCEGWATPGKPGLEPPNENRDKIKIDWKFDRRAARRKFGYKRNSFTRSET
jgi:hypothetical protein